MVPKFCGMRRQKDDLLFLGRGGLGMLSFVGLGLWDERSITVEGKETIAAADHVYLERYTSSLQGTTPDALETYHNTDLTILTRADVEQSPDRLLDQAETDDVALLVGGDPMISTTHVDLRLRAAERGIDISIIHGVSIAGAAAGITGLQNYRFGKATTLPFPGTFGDQAVPDSVRETIETNLDTGLHTLVYLDISDSGEYLHGGQAADALSSVLENRLGVVVGQAGSQSPAVVADRLDALSKRDCGDPLHILIIPGPLHDMEATALKRFAGAPAALLE